VPKVASEFLRAASRPLLKWASLKWGSALLAFASGPVAAQTTDLEWRSIVTQGQSSDVRMQTLSVPGTSTVMGRYRPGYFPIGGRIGSFFLYPRLTTMVEATDNLFAYNGYKTSDVTTRVNGQVLLTSNWGRHAFDIQAFAGHSLHARHGSEDVTSFGGVIDGRVDFGSAGAVTLVASSERGTLERSDFTSPSNALKPVAYDRHFAEGKLQHTFNRFQASAAVKATRLEYRNTIARDGSLIDQQSRNGDFWAYQASVSYRLKDGLRIISNGSYTVAHYDVPLGEALKTNNLSRNSHKTRVEVGLRFDFTNYLVGVVKAGWIGADYADPRLRPFSGAAFSADLVWTPNRSTSLRIKADRRIDENTSVNSVGMRVTEGGLTLEHELAPNLLIAGRASYADLAPLGSDPKSQLVVGGGQLRYLVNRRLNLMLDLTRQSRTSQSEQWRFDENRVMIQAVLTL